MDRETLKKKPLTRLEDMLVDEVSIVNKAANGTKFLIIKSEDGENTMDKTKEQAQLEAEAAADKEFDDAFREPVTKGEGDEDFEDRSTPAGEPVKEPEAVEKAEETPAVVETPAAAEPTPVPVQKTEETPAPVREALTKSDLEAELSKFVSADSLETMRAEFTAGLSETLDAVGKLTGQVQRLAKALVEEREGRKADRAALAKAEGELEQVRKAFTAVPASRPVEGKRRELPQRDESAEWDIDMTRPLRGGVSKSIDFGRDDE